MSTPAPWPFPEAGAANPAATPANADTYPDDSPAVQDGGPGIPTLEALTAAALAREQELVAHLLADPRQLAQVEWVQTALMADEFSAAILEDLRQNTRLDDLAAGRVDVEAISDRLAARDLDVEPGQLAAVREELGRVGSRVAAVAALAAQEALLRRDLVEAGLMPEIGVVEIVLPEVAVPDVVALQAAQEVVQAAEQVLATEQEAALVGAARQWGLRPSQGQVLDVDAAAAWEAPSWQRAPEQQEMGWQR